MSRVEEIRERLEAATPGPWEEVGPGYTWVTELSNFIDSGSVDLIANAPADIAYLLAENTRLRAQLDTVRELADDLHRAETVYEIRAALNQGGETNGE